MTADASLEKLELTGPPRNEAAERGVLCCCLLDNEKLDDVALVLRPSDFHVPQHQVIFRALLDLHEAGKRPDVVLLLDWLKKTERLKAAGGPAKIAEIAEAEATAYNATHYAAIIRDCAILRDILGAGSAILDMAKEARTADPRELISRAEAAVFGILDQRESNDAVPIQDVLFEAMEAMGRRFDGGGQSGLRTGFLALDELVGGLRGGELVILAARPGMGKSALATNIAERVSMDSEKTVLFFSLEMHRIELAERIICGRARVDSRKARNGVVSDDERRRLVEHSNRFAPAPLFVDDTPGRNMAEIAAVCRRQKRRSKLDLVVVDYLQRIAAEDSRAPREQQVAAIAVRLKTLARELNVPVLCLAQINRQVEGQADKRPSLSHLRESGAIEQEADQVWFIHRQDYYEADETKHTNIAEVLVKKNRGGATGDAPLAWLGEFTRFETMAREDAICDRAPRPASRINRPFGSRQQRRATPSTGKDFDPDEWNRPGSDVEN